MHRAEGCEQCQVSVALYGVSYFRGDTDEHIDAPSLVIAFPSVAPAVAEGLRQRLASSTTIQEEQ